MSFEPAHRHIRTQHTRNTWCNLPCPSDSYSIFTSRVVLRLLMSTLTYILPTPNVTYSQVWQGKGAGASFYRRHWCGFQYNSDHWPRRAGCRTSLNVVTFFLLLFFFYFLLNTSCFQAWMMFACAENISETNNWVRWPTTMKLRMLLVST